MSRAVLPIRAELHRRVCQDLELCGRVMFDTQLAIWRYCDSGVVAVEGLSAARPAISSEVFVQTLRQLGAPVERVWSPAIGGAS